MEKWELRDLYPGCHIRCKMNNFYHHAIYIGNGEVVQFGLPNNIFMNPKDVRIIRSPLSDFSKSNFIEVRVYSKLEKLKKRNDKEIVNYALSKIGEGNYNILHNNCEHFANECVFGEKKSSQIDKVSEHVLDILANDKTDN